MTVVAEGVEDAEVMNYLNDIGCDIVQGYYISRPIPEDELLAFAQIH
jgi:EAL domain-containing protein (putative c-di-GMP-specific phosphodiesterase class I)